ncbi:MAG: rhomboid family intramembrane serine protease, partial [Acidimicrobiales bacterium]
YLLGDAVERALGRVRFVVLYFTSLFGGGLGALILDPGKFTAGASGAIYGLMGAALAGQRAAGVSMTDSGLIYVLLLNLAITFGLPGISIGGHLGGLAAGFIGGWVLFDLAPRLKDRWMAAAGCAAIGVACFVASLYVASNPLT